MTIEIKPPAIKTNPDRAVLTPTSIKVKGSPGTPVEDTTAKPNPNKQRAEFKPEEFVRAIQQHGHHVIWRKALLCPCHLEDIQQADPSCTLCDGSGFYYVDPIAIRAQIFSVDKDMKLYEKMGSWLAGQSSITVEPQYHLGYRDSIEMRDAIMVFDEILKKGNRRGRRVSLPAGYDMARYRVVNVVFAQYRNPNKTVVTLEQGKHFDISPDGWLRWLSAGNNAVPDKGVITLRYEFHPTYVIESYPHAIRQENVAKKAGAVGHVVTALPIQCVGRLDYLVSTTNTPTQLPTTW